MTINNDSPKYVTDDPRLGKRATAYDGCTGVVQSILRFPDGTECIEVYNEKTGMGHGGLTADQITIEEVKEPEKEYKPLHHHWKNHIVSTYDGFQKEEEVNE